MRRRSLLTGVVLLVVGLTPSAPRLSSPKEDTVSAWCVSPPGSTRCFLTLLYKR